MLHEKLYSYTNSSKFNQVTVDKKLINDNVLALTKHQPNREAFGDVTNLVKMNDEMYTLNTVEKRKEKQSLSFASSLLYNRFDFREKSDMHTSVNKENCVDQRTQQSLNENLPIRMLTMPSNFSIERHWRPW